MLTVRNLHAWYGRSHVLHGVDLDVRPGEIVSLLGRNGSGRSTAVKAVMGLVAAQGSVRWQPPGQGDGGAGGGTAHELLGLAPHRIARLGLGYVPEQRDVFPRLTVAQNLLLGLKSRPPRPPRWQADDIHALFPRLRERRDTEAGVLSGGEQQMLTLGRTLMGDPDLILIDEPTEGLAPLVVAQVAAFLRTLRERGLGVLLVEQKLAIALDVADRCLVMGQGRIVFEGTPAELRAAADVRREWLEV